MTVRSTWRGHTIVFKGGAWWFEDTDEPVLGDKRGDCGHCNGHRTIEGHDWCLGTLPGVMNACCGHGELGEAYVQMPDGTITQGQDALDLIDELRVKST
jgi:hypothetical protein